MNFCFWKKKKPGIDQTFSSKKRCSALVLSYEDGKDRSVLTYLNENEKYHEPYIPFLKWWYDTREDYFCFKSKSSETEVMIKRQSVIMFRIELSYED